MFVSCWLGYSCLLCVLSYSQTSKSYNDPGMGRIIYERTGVRNKAVELAINYEEKTPPVIVP